MASWRARSKLYSGVAVVNSFYLNLRVKALGANHGWRSSSEFESFFSANLLGRTPQKSRLPCIQQLKISGWWRHGDFGTWVKYHPDINNIQQSSVIWDVGIIKTSNTSPAHYKPAHLATWLFAQVWLKSCPGRGKTWQVTLKFTANRDGDGEETTQHSILAAPTEAIFKAQDVARKGFDTHLGVFPNQKKKSPFFRCSGQNL